MQSIPAPITLLITGAAAALALIIGHSPVLSSAGQTVAGDNGWSTSVKATELDNGWS
ncbi:hypothetical protein [Streptomyces sp. G-G2]|uniref:hypothetical protein n=1 Tax=Streptomyces sp. G-G2 TaxID=3046201 RepID=UPI0024B9C1C4|nr:hypothetical protein [Streptomyces sp. G-G2]MDJ0381537.1 hypothetical protein [Streptomyces sp. G-G2]